MKSKEDIQRERDELNKAIEEDTINLRLALKEKFEARRSDINKTVQQDLQTVNNAIQARVKTKTTGTSMWNNIITWIVWAACIGGATYISVTTLHQQHELKAQCIELKTQVTELQSELTAAKALVQKNEIGELKRRWRLFGER